MTEEAKRAVARLRNFSVSDTVEYATEIVSNARKAAILIESLSAELEQIKRERDAAVEELREWGCYHCAHKSLCPAADDDKDEDHDHVCSACDRKDCLCKTCSKCENWQWEGVKEE